jgi:predicted anti-sigma-YlaC factor YlaD
MNILRSFLYLLFLLMLFLVTTLISPGCSVKKIAIKSVANSLTEEGAGVFATDNDPELVAEALPFALKSMEALLQSVPEHRKLLIGTSAGFVQYAHGFVLQPAELKEMTDLEASRHGKERARKLFIRARDYGLKALELKYENLSVRLYENPYQALKITEQSDIEAMYWTGVAWLSAISVGISDLSLVADLPAASALLERCLELDESWNEGAIHEVFIVFDASRSEAEGGGLESAERHYLRAMELNEGKSISPKVSFAGSVCVQRQDRDQFITLLNEAMLFDVDQYPEYRLSNILAQRKAAWLLEHVENYFI